MHILIIFVGISIEFYLGNIPKLALVARVDLGKHLGYVCNHSSLNREQDAVVISPYGNTFGVTNV